MMNFNYNPYYPSQYNSQMQRMPQLDQQYSQFSQPNPVSYPQNPQPYPQPNIVGLQGKSVESIDVVKAMDIPLDGSITYFPLTDGSAIITKQLQQDGTSKTIIYKPFVEPTTPVESIKYVTEQQVKELIEVGSEGIQELQDDIQDLKRELRNVNDEIKDLRKLKDIKRKSDE